MAERGGQSGNTNSVRGQLFRDQLRRVFAQDPHRLRNIAEKLITKAEEGEPWAVRELMDRIDGKAVQAMTVANEDGSPLLAGIRVEFVRPGATSAPQAAPADGNAGSLP